MTNPDRIEPRPAEDDSSSSKKDPSIRVLVEAARRDEEGQQTNEHHSNLPFSKARCIALVATLTGASFLNIVSTQAVVIILPVIRKEIGIPESRGQWLVSSYSMTFGCFLLLWGRIADVFGKRLIFIAGTAIGVIATAINPFIKNEIAFNVFRGLAGIGGAANVPTAIGILGVTFPSAGKARNYSFAAYSAGSAVGGAAGNLVGGLISAYASWKWVFGTMALLGAIIGISAIFVIPPTPPKPRDGGSGQSLLQTVDWLGGFLVTASILALLFALTEGNVVGWNTVQIPVLIVIFALLMGTFVLWQWYQETRTSRQPLMKISMFKNVPFTSAIVIMGIFFGAYTGFTVFATYFWQNYQGLSTIQTAIRFIPANIAGISMAFIMSFLIAKIPTYALLIMANLALALACLLFAIPVPSNTTYWAIGMPAMVLTNIGADTTWPCITQFISITLPQSDQALGGAFVNSAGQIGRAIGLAISTAIQTGVMAKQRGEPVTETGGIIPWEDASLAGLRAANWYNFALVLVAAALTFLTFRRTGIVGKIDKKP